MSALPPELAGANSPSMNFASDNWAGASLSVMAALTRHSSGAVPAYGNDPLTDSVTARFGEIFEKDVQVFYTSTGTAANALALASLTSPGGVIFCHPEAHIRVDECGSPEFMTGGARLVPVTDPLDGKITADGLSETLPAYPDGSVPSGRVCGVSISQASECGTLYTPAEIRAIKTVAERRGMPLHMDGARFANALVSLGCSPAEMTWKSGVDVLSFGGTKNGCWCAEAIVFFNKDLGKGFEYQRKRAGQVLSKARFVSAQFEGYFEDDAWLLNARHANAMAAKLSSGMEEKGGRLAWATQANEVFPILKKSDVLRMEQAGARFYEWPHVGISGNLAPSSEETCLRLVTNFATSEGEVDQILSLL